MEHIVMSNTICAWKSNDKFRKEDAMSVYGQLVEGDSKQEQVDETELIEKYIEEISRCYPPPATDNL